MVVSQLWKIIEHVAEIFENVIPNGIKIYTDLGSGDVWERLVAFWSHWGRQVASRTLPAIRTTSLLEDFPRNVSIVGGFVLCQPLKNIFVDEESIKDR